MILENDSLCVTFEDSDGSLVSLINKSLGEDAIKSAAAAENFRLSIPLERDWTHIVIGRGHPVRLAKISQSEAELIWPGIAVEGQAREITVSAHVALRGDELVSHVSIENHSQYKIDYIWYPILGGVTKLCKSEKDDLISARFCGKVERNIYEQDWVDENNRYWYTAREFMSAIYPRSTHMQFVTLANERCGLYLSSRDNEDFYTGFYLEHERACTPMTLSIVKAPFLKAGEGGETCENVVAFFEGDWHVAAGKYRTWLGTWMKRKERAEWVKNLDGWLAFQGHCGDMHIAHPYEEYPEWLEKAKSVGLDTIHIHCGVHEEGIEGGYPYWSNFSKRMGGREKLVEIVNKIHEMGGRVITFTKDNKVNLGLPEYEDKFSQYAVRLRDGACPRVSYCVGTLDMLCSGAQLATMCRAHKGWQEFILHEMDEIAQVGFDGNMIDEWCSGLELCMSEKHGHKKPTDQLSQQHVLGRRILETSLKHNPEYLLAGEEICDAAYQYMDLSFARGGGDAWWGRDPRFYELFRCSIPDMQCTAEILQNEYNHLNYAFACGYMLVLCIDYYHGGPERYPEFSAYFREIIRLRKQVRRFFLEGEFRDALDFWVKSDGNVKAKSWKLREKTLIVLTNDGPAVSFSIELGRISKTLISDAPFTSTQEYVDLSAYSGIIAENSVAILEF